MSLIRKHVAVLQAWACLDLVLTLSPSVYYINVEDGDAEQCDYQQTTHGKDEATATPTQDVHHVPHRK